jgi:hypothetical protein
MDPAEYCRQIEAYLCRKNEGHLIRIAGPVFEQVTGWATQGVPLAVALRGIDQYCERYYAKGPRRRPVRVEFCEGDILSLFDDWRRAVGVSRGVDENGPAADSAHHVAADHADRRRDSLPAHLDRAIARLTAARGGRPAPGLEAALDTTVRELDGLRASAKQARGEARQAIMARLQHLDASLLAAARDGLHDARRSALRSAAEAEIAPFASRMPAEARARAIEAAFERLLRDAAGLPVLGLEP